LQAEQIESVSFMSSDFQMVERCIAVARGEDSGAINRKDAQVFHVASMILRWRFPTAARNLQDASDLYFDANPTDVWMGVAGVVEEGCIANLPHFHEALFKAFVKP
jgi:hypothetical protein